MAAMKGLAKGGKAHLQVQLELALQHGSLAPLHSLAQLLQEQHVTGLAGVRCGTPSHCLAALCGCGSIPCCTSLSVTSWLHTCNSSSSLSSQNERRRCRQARNLDSKELGASDTCIVAFPLAQHIVLLRCGRRCHSWSAAI